MHALMLHRGSVTLSEKIRSGLAGGVAILLLGWMLHYLPHIHYPLLMLSSIAASAVLLFAVPHSPLAQPWNLIVGHLISAMAGWCCSLIIPDPLLAGAVAVGLAILLMHLLDALHPPGAATALTMVLSSSLYHDMGLLRAFYIVAANTGLSLLLALFINNLLPHRRYPMNQLATPAIVKSGPFIIVEKMDIAWALAQMNGVIDVSEDDLARIYDLALQNSQRRIETNNLKTL
jgi:CBS-domain-containing membrane protein